MLVPMLLALRFPGAWPELAWATWLSLIPIPDIFLFNKRWSKHTERSFSNTWRCWFLLEPGQLDANIGWSIVLNCSPCWCCWSYGGTLAVAVMLELSSWSTLTAGEAVSASSPWFFKHHGREVKLYWICFENETARSRSMFFCRFAMWIYLDEILMYRMKESNPWSPRFFWQCPSSSPNSLTLSKIVELVGTWKSFKHN